MFNYKNLMKSINIEGKQDDETDTNDMYDIKNIETAGTSENLLDSIIQHPFIDNIDFDESSKAWRKNKIVNGNGTFIYKYYIDFMEWVRSLFN